MAERRNGEVNARHMLPQTINLPELPLVRVQERHGGFESTTSTFDIPSSPRRDLSRNNFETRRRTVNHTINGGQSFVNDATDQKIPRIIRPIPDEMEEINMKGSISIEQTDKEEEGRAAVQANIGSAGKETQRILVQHNGDKINLKDRV